MSVMVESGGGFEGDGSGLLECELLMEGTMLIDRNMVHTLRLKSALSRPDMATGVGLSLLYTRQGKSKLNARSSQAGVVGAVRKIDRSRRCSKWVVKKNGKACCHVEGAKRLRANGELLLSLSLSLLLEMCLGVVYEVSSAVAAAEEG